MLTNSKIPAQVLSFAGAVDTSSSKLAPYKMFVDYWNHFMSRNGKEGLEYSTTTVNENDEVISISFDEKEVAMNKALTKEIMRHAGVSSFDGFPLEDETPA